MGLPVLLVDDSAMSRKLTMRAFPAGWEVEITQAAGGEEALALLDRHRPRIMFLDLNMPGMDGFQVLEAMRERVHQGCFVVVISADVQPKARQRAMDLGAGAFLHKPVDAAELEAVLREYGFL